MIVHRHNRKGTQQKFISAHIQTMWMLSIPGKERIISNDCLLFYSLVENQLLLDLTNSCSGETKQEQSTGGNQSTDNQLRVTSAPDGRSVAPCGSEVTVAGPQPELLLKSIWTV